MRKLIAMFLGCLIFSAGCVVAQTASPLSGSLIIKGKIGGIRTGKVTVTTEVFADKKSFDANIVEGKFEVKIGQPSPTLYSMTINGDQATRLLLFADNGIVQVEGNKSNWGNANVSGSLSHREFTMYNTMVSNYDNLLGTIQEVWATLEEKGELLPKVDSLQRVFKRTSERKDSSIATWITQHNKSFVSPLIMILNYATNGDPSSLRNMFNALTPEVKKSYYGNFLDIVITQKEGLNIGKMAPLFSQADPTGKPIALESFRGKYVLIDFWASWCGPCRQENPNVVRAYNKFKSRNFEIIGVSLDRPGEKDKWLAAIKSDGLTWPQVSDLKYWRNEVAVQYGVQQIPANFLLDKDGKIIAKELRGQELELALEKLLR